MSDRIFKSRMKMISKENRKHVKTDRENTSIEDYGMDTAVPDSEMNTAGFSGQWVSSCPSALEAGSQPS